MFKKFERVLRETTGKRKSGILILANNDIGLYKFRKELIQEMISPGSVVDGRNGEGLEVYIALPNGECIQQLENMGCHFVEVPIDRRGINPLKDFYVIEQYIKLIRFLKPDKVITYTIKPNIYGGIVSQWCKIPYYVNITGLGTAFQKKGVLQWLVTKMYCAALAKAEIVFFENKENQKVFEYKKIVTPEQSVVLNGAGVNLDEYSYTEYPKEMKPIRFLFVGRVMKEKGVDELFEAMEQLVNHSYSVHLDVVGPCEEDYVPIMKKKEQKGWLSYHGYQKDVKPFIAQSHCFVLPSWHEGMANTNLECAAMGRPVITSDIPGCREAVADGKSGYLIQSRSVEELYKGMKKFVELPYERCREMGLAARQHMEDNFDKKRVVESTVKWLF